ncbi:MAG: peptidyl-prolyl cis-trans isomerase, partial [Campylobacterota bacterium]|nr:peptidyl-prolyl cis-trans isomerase [Campylobacterota bacterium]
QILATVNGNKIMESHFLENFKEQSLANQKVLLNGVIVGELITQYAQKQKAYNDKEILDQLKKVQEQHTKVKRRFNEQDKRMIHGILAIRHLAKQAVANKLSDKAIRSYYDENKDKFKNLTYTNAYKVSVDSKESADKIIEQLSKSKKEQLTDLFVKLPKKFKGVKLQEYRNYYGFGRPSSKFNRTIFSLDSGEYTQEPLFDGKTYYIFYCEKKLQEDKIAPFKHTKENLELMLPEQFVNEWIDAKVVQLFEDSNITNNLK